GLKKLFDFFEGHYNSKHYKKLKAESEELRSAMTGKIRSATIGINFDENLVPISMGLVGFSDKMYEDSGTVIDRNLSFGSKSNDHKVMRDLHERFDDPQSAKR
ncbi:DNA mismatch repair protein MutS, partial [[Eubacterium] siraeum]|nr:DNA mismatch repair protein MutS [[Eubacterium] siraeum]